MNLNLILFRCTGCQLILHLFLLPWRFVPWFVLWFDVKHSWKIIFGSMFKAPADTVKPWMISCVAWILPAINLSVVATIRFFFSLSVCLSVYSWNYLFCLHTVNNTTIIFFCMLIFDVSLPPPPPFFHHAKFVDNDLFLSCLILLQILVIWYTGLYLSILTIID